MNHDFIKNALLQWVENFVEQPHPSLGGWPPCPFARKARLTNSIDIRPGTDVAQDARSLLDYSWEKEVVIFWYEPSAVPSNQFVEQVRLVNLELMPQDVVVLEDHPEVDEIISGVKMNFGPCALIVCQQLSKLNLAADQLSQKDYYHTWSQEDLDKIVTWRYKDK